MMKDAYAARFFLLTFIITWGAWGLLILLGADDLDPSSPLTLLFLLGGFGPSLAGLILTAVSDGRAGLRNLWQRTLRLRFGFRWYLIIFLLFPAVNALTLLISWAAGGSVPDFSLARSLAAIPAGIIPTLIIFFITGALAEEYGWRGYALDRVQAKWGAAIGSLLLGVLWALWHLPLFFMAGAPQTSSGVSFLLFAAWIIALSPIYTWVYNGTRRSLAAVLLLHWVSTIAGSILPTEQSETIGLAIISVVILIAMLRRPAHEIGVPAQPSGNEPAFHEKGSVP